MSNMAAWDSWTPRCRTSAPVVATGCRAICQHLQLQLLQSAYPFALGPRLGVAYQLKPKTVFAVDGDLLTNSLPAQPEPPSARTGYLSSVRRQPLRNISRLRAQFRRQLGLYHQSIRFPVPGTVGIPGVSDPYLLIGNENRPPRINQFSFGIQQEITPNFIMEASYVGNRAVWLGQRTSGHGGGTGVTASGQRSNLGTNVRAIWLLPLPGNGPSGGTGGHYNNYADYLLTLQPLNSTAVQARLAASGHAGFTPYAGFPATNSLTERALPVPTVRRYSRFQFPDRASKYDSLQLKVTKRFSHGLQVWRHIHLGAGLRASPRARTSSIPRALSVGTAANPNSGSELQRHLHRSRGVVHSEISALRG
jgi:hypothetical protein